jgi:hypothetical protein
LFVLDVVVFLVDMLNAIAVVDFVKCTARNWGFW